MIDEVGVGHARHRRLAERAAGLGQFLIGGGQPLKVEREGIDLPGEPRDLLFQRPDHRLLLFLDGADPFCQLRVRRALGVERVLQPGDPASGIAVALGPESGPGRAKRIQPRPDPLQRRVDAAFEFGYVVHRSAPLFVRLKS